MLKTAFKNKDLKRLIYHIYNNFNNKYFQNNPKYGLSKYSKNYEKHSVRKTKIFDGNQKSHVNKILCKEIMKRSELKSKANRTK